MPKRSFHLIVVPALAASAAALVALAPPSTAHAQSTEAPAAEAAPAAAPAPSGGGGKLYRWVDKDKTVHYSDRPQPGADALEAKPAQTYSAPAPAPSASAAPRSAGREAIGPATQRASCGITSPSPDQVFPNVQSVMISYRGPNDGTAQLQLGGTSSQVLTAPAGQSFTIAPIARGTYTATVTITGESGAELCRTQTVTFHVRQPSLLAPVRQQMNRRAN